MQEEGGQLSWGPAGHRSWDRRQAHLVLVQLLIVHVTQENYSTSVSLLSYDSTNAEGFERHVSS